MSTCDRYDGTAAFVLTERGDVTVTHADPLVHVYGESIGNEVSRSLVEDFYVLREKCWRRNAWHAVRRERPLPSWTREEIEQRRRDLTAD